MSVRESPDVVTATADYASRFAGPVGEWFLADQAAAARAALGPVDAVEPLLDVGGGHAQLVPMLATAGFRPVALGSPEAGRERLQDWLATGQCHYVAADLVRLPFADRSFTASLCVRQLTHLTEWRSLVRELCRVSDRRVIVDYPSRRSVNIAADVLFELKRRVEGNTRRFKLFWPREIDRAFRDAGFDIAATYPQYLWPMALHRAIGSPSIARLLESPGRLLRITRFLGSPVVAAFERREA
jgi:hypothetical protein